MIIFLEQWDGFFVFGDVKDWQEIVEDGKCTIKLQITTTVEDGGWEMEENVEVG